MAAKKITGIVTALVTPLTPSGALDHEGLERLIERQITAGVDSIFILGSVGEGPLLPDQVFRETVTHASKCVRGRLPLLGGASENSLDRCAVRMTMFAEAGYDAIVATLPYYGWPPRHEDSVRFFTRLAALSPLPLVAYNLPKAVGWQMPPEALEALFEVKNLICIKDTHGDEARMRAIASSPRRPAHFSYLPGNSALTGPLMAAGADGVVSTPANLFPEPFVDRLRAHRTGRTDLAQVLDTEVMPLVTALLDLMPTGAAALKGLLALEGVCGPTTVAPWPEMNRATMEAARSKVEAARSAITAFRRLHG
jgi:4-hydroxy-tetrahydrodipicolinate synthase